MEEIPLYENHIHTVVTTKTEKGKWTENTIQADKETIVWTDEKPHDGL